MASTVDPLEPHTEQAASTSEQAQGTTRTSARTRNKSQRFIELEETNRAFAAAKARAAAEGSTSFVPEKSRVVKTKSKGKARSKAKKEELYCICKDQGEGPMIECGGCNDWLVIYSCQGLHLGHEADPMTGFISPVSIYKRMKRRRFVCRLLTRYLDALTHDRQVHLRILRRRDWRQDDM
jgi:hypothetical protein